MTSGLSNRPRLAPPYNPQCGFQLSAHTAMPLVGRRLLNRQRLVPPYSPQCGFQRTHCHAIGGSSAPKPTSTGATVQPTVRFFLCGCWNYMFDKNARPKATEGNVEFFQQGLYRPNQDLRNHTSANVVLNAHAAVNSVARPRPNRGRSAPRHKRQFVIQRTRCSS